MNEVVTIQAGDIEPFSYVLHRIQTDKAWSFPRHNHNRVLEFYYLFQGELVQVFDSGELVMEEGDFLLISENFTSIIHFGDGILISSILL